MIETNKQNIIDKGKIMIINQRNDLLSIVLSLHYVPII